jgi:DNA-binding response OmpR family regulator
MRILLVEDDESIIDLVTTVLSQQNYIVDTATDGEAGWELAEAFPYDLVLLDIVLPKLDGIALCRRLRDHKKQSLVMLLTAQDAISDKLIGLQAGADDYLVKPFDVQELAARIHALLRRGNPITETILRCGDLRLNPTACEVTYGSQMLRFSRKEYLLVELFLRHQHRVFSRSAIVDQIWSFNEDPPNEDTVKSHIKSIRRKLDAVGAGDLIETLYGQGYRVNPGYLSPAKAPRPKTTQTADLSPSSAQQSALSLSTSAIWQRSKGVNLKRLAVLEQAVQALQAKQLQPKAQQADTQASIQTAHKLIGSLGTFGFEAGSKTAQQIEATLQRLAVTAHPAQLDLMQLEGWVQSLRALLQQNDAMPLALPVILPSLVSDHVEPLLLVLVPDHDWMNPLAVQIAGRNLQPLQVATVETAISQCQQQRPHIALLDFAITQHVRAQELLALLQLPPRVPILFLSDRANTRTRIEALQAGGDLFLQHPASPTLLQAALDLLYPPQTAFRVLLVDDDPLIAELLAACWDDSIHLSNLADPAQFWDILSQIDPDLLILDVDMPNINGIDLCQTVRCDPQWNWLPIVFLTAQPKPEIAQQVFAAGADDLIAKPIRPAEFSVRILNRLRRASKSRALSL